MKIKRTVSILLATILCLSSGVTAFASDGGEDTQTASTQTVIIDEKTMDISSSEITGYEEYGKGLAAAIRATDERSLDETVKSFCGSHANPIFEDVQNIISENSRHEGQLYLETPQSFVENYEKTYVIDENRTLTITPTYIVVDILTISDDSSKALSPQATTSSKSGISSKTYYSVAGTKVFSLAVACTFYYNGSKAWYKSGFDYYYTKGTLSVWQVSNWRGWKEASGTSYKAYCSGNFHWGIEYEGNGLVIQDYYCKNTLTCNKSGTISTSAAMS